MDTGSERTDGESRGDAMKDYKGIKKKPRIRMLTSCFGWDSGDEYNVQMIDDEGNLYINDVNQRWTVVYKSDEGKEFVWLRKDAVSA